MNQDATYEPTLLKLQKAKAEGNVAKSSDLASVLFLCIAVGVLIVWIPTALESIIVFFKSSLQAQNVVDAPIVKEGLGWQLFNLLLIPCGLMLLASLFAGVVQVGGLFVPQVVALNPSRLVSQFDRIGNANARMQLLFALCKLTFASAASLAVFWHHKDELLALSIQNELQGDIIRIAVISIQAVFAALGALFIIGACDYCWQRYSWRSDLKMTRQEIIEEHREREGTGQTARRHAIWMAKQNTKTVQPSLYLVGRDAVVTIRWNPTTMSAPIVLDVIRGEETQLAISQAKQQEIPTVEHHIIVAEIIKLSNVGLGVPHSLHGEIASLLMSKRREER